MISRTNRHEVALIGGVPPVCDRCSTEDAKIVITLPTYGERCLCNSCIVELLETGLKNTSETK